MNLEQARQHAERLRAILAPVCARIEIAGSVRRAKPDGIHDIEIVAVPLPIQAVFGRAPISELHILTNTLVDRVTYPCLRRRLDKNGRPAWGQKYRRAVWHLDERHSAPFDLFIAEPENFGALFCIRTGPHEFSEKLVTARQFGGAMPRGMKQANGYLWRLDAHDEWERVDTPEEEDFFATLGLTWIEPHARSEDLLRLVLTNRVRL